jgi:hypothetical protein
MATRFALLFGIIFFSVSAFAQTYTITGSIADFKDTSSLIGVTVVLRDGNDTSVKTPFGGVTDASGNFEIDGVSAGKYLLHLEYLGYKAVNKMFSVADKNVSVGILAMKATTNELKGVTVSGKQIRAEQRGDTTSFHADAFKVNPDATTEDLITKMPGITSDNSGVKVNGEAVQQVYVDGKPFFGNDPSLSVKNLPAEVVDKIEIFDQLSDQGQFTGFDDGNSQKTMNVVTRKDKRQGEFGKIYGGYGDDGRFSGGESFNSFRGDQRISIIELSNNINQQNFSSQDLLGISGSGGGGGRGGGAFGSGNNGGSSAGSNFLTGQQSGITTTHSAGINYSDQWGKKVKISASYFFNYTSNVNNPQIVRNYILPTGVSSDSVQTSLYNEKDNSTGKNFNNRFNVRFEYAIDSSNSLIITPNFSLQNNYSVSGQTDSSFALSNMLLKNSTNNSVVNSAGYTFSNNILFRHKLHKKGRTISLNVGISLNEKTGDGIYNTISASVDSENVYQPPVQLDQHYNLYNNSNTISSNLSYTEPLGKKSQLQFSYSPSVTNSKSDKETDTLNNTSQQLNFDTTLSNKYKSTYTTQKGGVSYRIGDKNYNLNIGANLQYAVLDGSQVFPSALTINRPFTNVLPIAFFNYKFKDGKNLRIIYRTNITPPNITQLQNVVDVSNPSLLSTGNVNLKQDYEQSLIIRYGLTRSKTAHNFFVYGYANYINNYIGNATYANTKRTDSIIVPGIVLTPGAQLIAPVNLNYYSNNKVFITYGVPFDILKSNLNLTGGLNYTHTPGLINNVADYSNNLVPTAGIVISSNISPKLDFTLSYTGNYNFVKNSLQGQANNNYYNHNASFKINWIFLKGFVLNTNITHAYYSTLSSSTGNIDFLLWNAYVGYKFLKDRSLEARISAFDILNQNKGVTRTVAANYVENDLSNVLQQYFMFQLTYTLRNFKGVMPEDQPGSDNGPHGPWGGGEHTHGNDHQN